MGDTATIQIEEKTPTGNKILTEAGKLMALAGAVRQRARERAASKEKPCPVAEAEADFAESLASHVHLTDTAACKERARARAVEAQLATIMKYARNTFRLVLLAFGAGGGYQVWQWIVWAFKHASPALLAAVCLSGCVRTTEQAATKEITHRVGVEAGKPVDVMETRTTETTSEKQTTADLGPLIAAAVKGALGDVTGRLGSLTSQVQAGMSAAKPKEPITGNSLLDAAVAAMMGYAAIKGTVAAGRKVAPKPKA